MLVFVMKAHRRWAPVVGALALAMAILALVALNLPSNPEPVELSASGKFTVDKKLSSGKFTVNKKLSSGKFTVNKKLLSPTGRQVSAWSQKIDVLSNGLSAAQVTALRRSCLQPCSYPPVLPGCSPCSARLVRPALASRCWTPPAHRSPNPRQANLGRLVEQQLHGVAGAQSLSQVSTKQTLAAQVRRIESSTKTLSHMAPLLVSSK